MDEETLRSRAATGSGEREERGVSGSDQVEVTDNPRLGRFEIRLDGELAGSAFYRLQADRIVFTHTEVDSAYEGRGLGSKLASDALSAAKDRGLTIVPECPFIKSYVKRHPEYVK